MAEVRVHLADHEYPIHIRPGALDDLGRFTSGLRRPTRVVVVTDENVGRLYEARALASLAAAGIAGSSPMTTSPPKGTSAGLPAVRLPPGEDSKSLATADALYTALLERGIDRKSLVVALGGGVVGDLVGFVAATILRGIDYLQVPTTLLAQVDSSIGGKTAVNHPLGKNLIGAFHQPVGVLTDPATLATLPPPEYASGLAEVVKTAMIRDAAFLRFLEDHAQALADRDAAALTNAIARSCEIKAEVVAADPRETTGTRAILNYGHTIGHALEQVSGYARYRHGEAVAVGMAAAAHIAARRGFFAWNLVDRQARLLKAFGLPIAAPELGDERLLPALYRDKKAEGGRLRFVLPTALGRVALFDDVTEAEVRQALESLEECASSDAHQREPASEDADSSML